LRKKTKTALKDAFFQRYITEIISTLEMNAGLSVSNNYPVFSVWHEIRYTHSMLLKVGGRDYCSKKYCTYTCLLSLEPHDNLKQPK